MKALVDCWRKQALRMLNDATATPSQRDLARRFLLQWMGR